MNCPYCKNATVKARATNFGDEYNYCRTCKVEVDPYQAALHTFMDLSVGLEDPPTLQTIGATSGRFSAATLTDRYHLETYDRPCTAQPEEHFVNINTFATSCICGAIVV